MILPVLSTTRSASVMPGPGALEALQVHIDRNHAKRFAGHTDPSGIGKVVPCGLQASVTVKMVSAARMASTKTGFHCGLFWPKAVSVGRRHNPTVKIHQDKVGRADLFLKGAQALVDQLVII